MTQAAIFYTPEAFTLPDERVYGRRSAGASFLPAYLRHSASGRFSAFVHDARDGEAFVETVRRQRPDAAAVWGAPWRMTPVVAEGTLFVFEPRLSPHAWRRHGRGAHAYSLCGLTHTVVAHAALDAIADLPLAPLYEWDALICTSRAVKAVVDEVIAGREAYLAGRFGPIRAPRVQTPVLPLGIDAVAFAPHAERRSAFRRAAGLAETALVVLSLGRFSVHGKANPLPLYLALERAAKAADVRPHLLLAGWFANDGQERLFREQAAALAPSVALSVVDVAAPDQVKAALSGADIFVSLADNLQESFGLTVVEAMAAGLPVVVSDWDGLRDTVEHGVQGFRIATVMAPAGAGLDLAMRYHERMDDYDAHIGAASQFTAVDVAAAGDALSALLAGAELRRSLGAAGQARARAVYDWGAVIPQYQALWAELGERRAAAGSLPGGLEPSRPDPFSAFASYPTRGLAAVDRVSLGPSSNLGGAAALLDNPGAALVPELLLDRNELSLLLARIPQAGSVAAATLVEALAPERRALAFRALVWLAKFDAIRIAPG